MKKEVFLAVAVGFVLGLIITFGIWTANNSLKNSSRPQQTADNSVNVIPSPTGTPETPNTGNQIPLSLISPAADETLVNTDSLSISGKTVPGAVVAITYESGKNILVADNNGNFSLDIKLDGGYNRITATAYDKDGNTNTAQMLITYTTSKI
jgi:hypothetical protein